MADPLSRYRSRMNGGMGAYAQSQMNNSENSNVNTTADPNVNFSTAQTPTQSNNNEDPNNGAQVVDNSDVPEDNTEPQVPVEANKSVAPAVVVPQGTIETVDENKRRTQQATKPSSSNSVASNTDANAPANPNVNFSTTQAPPQNNTQPKTTTVVEPQPKTATVTEPQKKKTPTVERKRDAATSVVPQKKETPIETEQPTDDLDTRIKKIDEEIKNQQEGLGNVRDEIFANIQALQDARETPEQRDKRIRQEKATAALSGTIEGIGNIFNLVNA